MGNHGYGKPWLWDGYKSWLCMGNHSYGEPQLRGVIVMKILAQVIHSYRCSKSGLGGLHYFKRTFKMHSRKKNTAVGNVAQLAEWLPNICRALA